MTRHIIAKGSAPLQGVRMSIAPSGLKVSSKGDKTRGIWLAGKKRGTIRGWSSASVRRLRETLFGYSVPDGIAYGITLTLPWSDEFCLDRYLCQKDFKRSLDIFRHRFERQFPNSSWIYRIELQQRGAPHVHAVFWKSPKDSVPVSIDDTFRTLWISSVPDLHGGRLDHFAKYGIKVNPMDGINKQALFRYLADHASKHKQAQLGWIGRQWGCFLKSNLVPVQTFQLPPFSDPHQEGVFWRMLSRITSYQVKADCPFGHKRVRNRRRRGVIFVPGGGSTVRRCYDFAIMC